MSNNLLRTAESLLTAAVLDLFPDAQILESGEEAIGFYCDFEFSQEFRAEYLPLIEERMKRIQARRPEIRILEMVPVSAKSFLENAGQRKRAQALPLEKGTLVQIYQIERAVDLCSGPLLKNWEKLGGYQLIEHQILPEGGVRLLGIAASNLQELQGFAKSLKRYAKANHLIRGEERQLFLANGEWCFYPLGVRLRQKILNLWSRQCAQEGYEEIVTSKNFKYSSSKKIACCMAQEGDISGKEKRFLGLFAPSEYWVDRLYSSYSEPQLLEGLISSLQFARKFSRIFDFEPNWILGKKSPPHLRQALLKCEFPFQEESGSKVEWRLSDGLGRAWTSGFLRVEKGEVCLSLFYALERFIALLLEKGEGELPFWLDPEQVRILLLAGGSRIQAMNLQASLEKEGFSCTIDEEKQRPPLLQKVPYVIFLGKQEAETNRLAVQVAGSNRKEEMSIDAFMQAIRKKIESK